MKPSITLAILTLLGSAMIFTSCGNRNDGTGPDPNPGAPDKADKEAYSSESSSIRRDSSRADSTERDSANRLK